MTKPSTGREMESIDTFCLIEPDGFHRGDYESALRWENHSYHQRRADLLAYLATEMSWSWDEGFPPIDDVDRLRQSLDVLLEAAHKRHQLLHERYVLEGKPPAPCEDECALTYIQGQPPTGHEFEGLSREYRQEQVLAIGHHRLQEVVRRIEEEQKLWDAYAKDSRSWHEERKNGSAKPEEVDSQEIYLEDLP